MIRLGGIFFVFDDSIQSLNCGLVLRKKICCFCCSYRYQFVFFRNIFYCVRCHCRSCPVAGYESHLGNIFVVFAAGLDSHSISMLPIFLRNISFLFVVVVFCFSAAATPLLSCE